MRSAALILSILLAAVGGAPFGALRATVAASPPADGSRLARGDPIPAAELEAFVDGAVHDAMVGDHIAGVTISIVQNGQTVLKKGYGFADLHPYRPVDPDRTLFRIGSISKTFNWILVMREVEAGRIRLDAPINLYLPEALRVPDAGYKHQVRVNDLMNHTPGFEDRVLGQLFERDYGRVRTLRDYLHQERPKRVREPGILVSYSNYGAALAGAAVAEVTGKSIEDLMDSEIVGPLGLGHTTLREPHPPRTGMPAPMASALAADVSRPYRWTSDGWRLRSFEYLGQIAPAGAVSSTASDMARYMLMLLGNGTLDGVKIYGPPTAAAFSTPLPAPAPGVPASRHGLFEQPLPGGLTGVGHGGDTLSFHSNLTLIPALNTGVFISTNTDTGGRLADSLVKQIVAHFYAPPPPPPPPGTTDLIAHRAAFEGVYLTDRRAYHGLEGVLDRIIGAATVKVTRDGRLTITDARSVQRFSPTGDLRAGRFLSDDGFNHLVFRIADGRALTFFAPWGGEVFERLPLWRQSVSLLAVTLLAALASLDCLIDLFARARRDFRESSNQRRAGLIQSTQAVLWLVAMSLFCLWAAGARDQAAVVYAWPALSLIVASTCALVAAVLGGLTLGLLPLVWRGGRRLDSWGVGRKTRFTTTVLIFLTLTVLLASWGALEPWSG